MKHLILARNTDERTAQRIREFADGDHLNAIKPEERASWLDYIGLQARWMVWSADTRQEAESLLNQALSAPNGFTGVHIALPPNGQLTSVELARIVSNLPSDH